MRVYKNQRHCVKIFWEQYCMSSKTRKNINMSIQPTLVACETKCTLIIVPCSEAVAKNIPLEQKAIAVIAERCASICDKQCIDDETDHK